jgi:hypothetical protein
LNLDPPDLHLPSSWDSRHEPLLQALNVFLQLTLKKVKVLYLVLVFAPPTLAALPTSTAQINHTNL